MKKITEDGLVYLNDIEGSAKLLIEDVKAIREILFDTDDKIPAPVRFEKSMDEFARVVFKTHMELEKIVESLGEQR